MNKSTAQSASLAVLPLMIFGHLTAFVTPAAAGLEYMLRGNETAFEDQLIVRLTPGSNPEALKSLLPGAAFTAIDRARNVYSVILPGHAGRNPRMIKSASQSDAMRQASSRLASRPDVVYVEPDHVRTAQGLAPNDPNFPAQWALQMVHAGVAWGTSPNSFLTAATTSPTRLKIAVLDSGADCTHPDFMNSGSMSSDSAVGGQISYAVSRAYYPTNMTSPACVWQDDYGHGTHVAGIIGAAANNGSGVAGLGYPLQLAIYKVLTPVNGVAVGADSVIAAAIIQAANDGAAVISMSLSGEGYSPTLQNAITYAWQMNVLVVAAAGNSGSNVLSFPGGADYVLGVGATDSNDQIASFSNFGSQVHIAAPGVNILSTLPGDSYGYMSGTSMAAPLVSALGGLLLNSSPGTAAAAVTVRIEQTAANNTSTGTSDPYLGYGRIDAAAALTAKLRASTQGGITGQVVDYLYYQPVKNITISAGGQTCTTDSTGMFRFYNLTPGQYSVVASGGSYAAISRQVVVAAGADAQFDMVLGGQFAQFSGTITDLGLPRAGIVVQAVSGGLIQATAMTDANGQYFLYVQPGTYQVRASGIGVMTTASAPQTVSAGQALAVNLQAPSFGTVSGHLSLGNGSPASNATVNLMGPAMTTSAVPDANGNYTSIGMPTGVYTATASLPGLANTTAPAIVSTDSSQSVNFQFADNGTNTVLAAVTGKTGTAPARIWTFSFSNVGANPVSGLSITNITFAQLGGTACTPQVAQALPITVGAVGSGSTSATNVPINFPGCTSSSRFKVTTLFVENGQSADGTLTLSNQFQ